MFEINFLNPKAVEDKVIIIRLDLNVPFSENEIKEATRINESIPTLKYLLKNKAKKIHILSHLGRPKGEVNKKYSLRIVLQKLSKKLRTKIEFRDDFTSGQSRVQLHENVRFFPGEKNNDPNFILNILKEIKPDIFIQDGFAVAHRSSSSVTGIGSYLPSYAGFLLRKEIENLSPFVLSKKTKGLTVIIGGAKIETKVGIVKHFCKIADNILIGGAIANAFLVAKGYSVGKSFYANEDVSLAKKIIKLAQENKTEIHLPVDLVAAKNLNDVKISQEKITNFPEDLMGFDLGSKSIANYKNIIKQSEIVIWNGPMGVFEKENFSKGTLEVLRSVAEQKSAKTILGGGDTLNALRLFSVEKSAFTHVSTGGGAMLKFLEGEVLPGIEILYKKKTIK